MPADKVCSHSSFGMRASNVRSTMFGMAISARVSVRPPSAFDRFGGRDAYSRGNRVDERRELCGERRHDQDIAH
jgi:hypothetical protein